MDNFKADTNNDEEPCSVCGHWKDTLGGYCSNIQCDVNIPEETDYEYVRSLSDMTQDQLVFVEGMRVGAHMATSAKASKNNTEAAIGTTYDNPIVIEDDDEEKEDMNT